MTTTTMEEIPLVFPSNAVDRPKRYLLDFLDSRKLVQLPSTYKGQELIQQDDSLYYSSSDGYGGGGDDGGVLTTDDSNTRGAASASMIVWLQSPDNPSSASSAQPKQALVTTSALIADPSVVSVSLSMYGKTATATSAGPTQIELQLPTVDASTSTDGDDSRTSDVVAVQAFADDDIYDDVQNEKGDTASIVKLVLVFRRGAIVTVRFDEELVPHVMDLQVAEPQMYLASAPALQERILAPGSQFELEQNRVGFIDSERVVLAFPPDPTHALLTVHLPSGQGGIWSESQCKEEMKAREGGYASFAGFFNSILGSVDGQGNPDMPATSALCVASNPSSLKGESLLEMDSFESKTTLVFTLHSDGSVRKWKIVKKADGQRSAAVPVASRLLPLEVTTMDTSSEEEFVLPSNTQWSDVLLSARIYNRQFYGLAVSIQTSQDDDDMVADEKLLDGNEEDFEAPFNRPVVGRCHLFTISGSDREKAIECKLLRVPPHAISLVGMSWVPTEDRSTLSAVFEAMTGIDGRKDRILNCVTYAHSNVSIVSQEPLLSDMISLDHIAAQEKNRICSLNYGAAVLMQFEDEIAEHGTTESDETADDIMNKALHELDTKYLRYLFRPVFPRGAGAVTPPMSACILRAFSKLMHGSRKDYEMSIELETVKKIHDWRALDARKAAAMTVSPQKNIKSSTTRTSAGLSVYDEFLEVDKFDDENLDPSSTNSMRSTGGKIVEFDDAIDDGKENRGLVIEAEIAAHEGRWKRLLLQIWEEEDRLRKPICVSWLDGMPVQIIVRGGVTSMITSSNSDGATTEAGDWRRILDNGAQSLITTIESDARKSKALYAIEDRIFDLVAEGQIAVYPNVSFTEELTSLARWARSREMYNDEMVFNQIMRDASGEELIAWVQSKPPGLAVPNSFYPTPRRTRSSSDMSIADSQTRLSACSLTIFKLDRARRLTLSRCLLFLELAGGSQATQASLRSYLRVLSVMWTSSQRVPMIEKPTARRIRFEGVNGAGNGSPPPKRSRSGMATVSILSPEEKRTTTVLDIFMINATKKQSLGTTGSGSFPGSGPGSLVAAFLDTMYPSSDAAAGLAPELNVIPSTQDVILEHPKLALRILSPFVAIVIHDDKQESIVARKEQIAACLLSIAALPMSSIPSKLRMDMQQTACNLLTPEGVGLNNLGLDIDITIAGIAWLENARQSAPAGESIAEKDTIKWLQKLLGDKATVTEIERVGTLPTARLLFDSLSLTTTPSPEDIPENEWTGILKVAQSMLRLSRLMNRLKIIEKPISNSSSLSHEDGSSLEMFLDLISNAIEEVESAFPAGFRVRMKEYTLLWSMKFQFAIRAHRFNDALEACARTPIDDHRQFNYKLLVENMVECGYLNRLLDMCTEVDMETFASAAGMDATTTTIDLYEVASEVMLRRTEPGDYYDLRATSSDSTTVADYAGALYSLHASQENWRRATQALDLRFNAALTSLTRSIAAASHHSIAFEAIREKVIMEDMVLSSCGSAHVMALVKDEADRFLVSGEYSPYTELPSSADELKGENGSDSRLSRFITTDHLEDRAVHSISMRTLHLDRGIDLDVVGSKFLVYDKLTKELVDILYSNGYIHYGNLLAEAQCKIFQRLNGSRGTRGGDIFGETLTDLLTKHLIPLTVQTSGGTPTRPTLHQLQVAADTAGCVQQNQTYIIAERTSSLSSQQRVAMRAAASILVKKFTSAYTSSTIHLAEAVTDRFLEMNASSVLPIWLERMLTGADVAKSFVGVGTAVFSPRSNPNFDGYVGNPQGLLSLYISHGMLIEACDLVSSVLSGFRTDTPHEFAAKNSSRLPEKGDVDYIPYKNIDLVWNLIEIATNQKGECPQEYTSRALAARNRMELSLKKHIENSRISEMGLQSARTSARVLL